jgi:hypothetical protein
LNPYYEQIVVGSSLRAILFASLRGLPLFFSTVEKPFEFDYFDPSVDLSSVRLNNSKIHWNTPKNVFYTGQNKIALWEHLLFVLGLKGLVPFSDMCSSIRLEENVLTGYSEYAKLRSVEFDRCYYFDEHATYNLLPFESKPNTYHVYDHFSFIRGGKHNLDLIESDERFCNKIWFYQTPRICGNTPVKDACVLSILSEDQIDDFDFSETIVRLTMIKKMKDLGLRGPRNGYQHDGKIRYRSFKAEALNRHKFLSSPPVWLETDSVKVPKISEKELLLQLPEISKKHKRILEALWHDT